jgi:hypothetical protein
MILTIKLFTFAFDYHDGWSSQQDGAIVSTDNVRAQVPRESCHFAAHLIPPQFKINALPNLLEFLSYVYCFTTFLGGPAIEFKRYTDFIGKKYTHTTIITSIATPEKDKNTKTSVEQKRFHTSAPASWFPVFQCFLIGVLFFSFPSDSPSKHPQLMPASVGHSNFYS